MNGIPNIPPCEDIAGRERSHILLDFTSLANCADILLSFPMLVLEMLLFGLVSRELCEVFGCCKKEGYLEC